ncbi:unnamed protein product [Symbiodinium necroappetens]|uniref:Uncharacterized protein n=1 Tax=Symbiodinium necroappetens TaxID=1628268 RepID=A0A812XX56_9DINO|nr:unnamed protein product [Symbiodinium necroappetens]
MQAAVRRYLSLLRQNPDVPANPHHVAVLSGALVEAGLHSNQVLDALFHALLPEHGGAPAEGRVEAAIRESAARRENLHQLADAAAGLLACLDRPSSRKQPERCEQREMLQRAWRMSLEALSHQEGCRVMFCGRGEQVGEQIAKELGDTCSFTKCDVNVEAEIKNVIDKTVEKWGKLDILFNNAGGPVGPFRVDQIKKEHLDANFSLNFNSMVMATKFALPHLVKQPTSSIINNSSIAAKKAGFGDPLYSACKGAMDAYSRVAAMQLAPRGVRVNCVSPGATATPIFWSGSPGSARGATLTAEENAKKQQKVEANIINNCASLRVGRAGTGLDIARAACFLASDDSIWITGQDLVIDGGMTTFDAPNKAWMADPNPVDPVPLRHKLSKL